MKSKYFYTLAKIVHSPCRYGIGLLILRFLYQFIYLHKNGKVSVSVHDTNSLKVCTVNAMPIEKFLSLHDTNCFRSSTQ